ncbi:MAG: hypothetical protein FJZ78_01650 [Bacteroidetes bacterium]|nr:hypothetical protein [Bacteroidota bacterium]
MTTKFRQFTILITTLPWLVGCFEPPEYPVTPQIEFNRVEFVDCSSPSVADTLVVNINFTDGDGNLGIDGEDYAPPFNNRWYYRTTPASQCEFGVVEPCSKIKRSSFDESKLSDFVTYKMRRTTPGYDTLPPFKTPYNCTNYQVVFDALLKPVDTVYFQLNKNFFNFFMDIYVKQNDGTFQKFDWSRQFTYPLCVTDGSNGRFPILAKDNNLSLRIPLEGTIRYRFPSTALLATFSIKTLKLKIKIMDRDLNLSNEIETPEFTLQQVLVKC